MLPIGPRNGATGGLAVRKCPRLFTGGECDEAGLDEYLEIRAINGMSG